MILTTNNKNIKTCLDTRSSTLLQTPSVRGTQQHNNTTAQHNTTAQQHNNTTAQHATAQQHNSTTV
jgi:hypothetical protein